MNEFLSEERMRGAVRAMFALNSVVTLAGLAWLTTAYAWPDGPAAGGHNEVRYRGPVGEIRPIDEATVSKTIYGKAVFRTNREVDEKVVDELGRFRFMGMADGAQGRQAYIKDTKQNLTLTFRVGELINRSFEVIAIEQDGVTLERNGEILQLTR